MFFDMGIDTRYDKLSHESIERLAQIVLLNNFFVFNRKIYRYRRGGPLNIPFVELLCDIYLQDWLKSLVLQVRICNSFYGRFHTQGFIVWNDTVEQLLLLFEHMEQSLDSDIRVTDSVDQHVHFMNVSIENEKGTLVTKIYRDLYR